MEIFIIRDGEQAGPFSEDSVQTMLADGKVRPNDLGWRRGLAAWVPVSEVLKDRSPEKAPESDSPPKHSPADSKPQDAPPMTAKQKAFLKYLGAEFTDNVTKARAALAISEALENPKMQNRIRKWHDEKLRLHPDVFQDEIDFRKANRAVRYLELCQTEGAEVVADVTKAHVQVLIESLDKHYPNWEADPRAAVWDYLLPSIGEHFPKLVRTAWKGRLKLGGMSKVAAVAAAAAGVPASPQQSASMIPPPPAPGVFAAIVRGLVYGVIILGLVIGGKYAMDEYKKPPGAPSGPATPAPEASPAKSEASAAAPAAPAAPPEEKAAPAPSPPPEPEKKSEPEKSATQPAAAAPPASAPIPEPAAAAPSPPAMAEAKPPVPAENPAPPAPPAPAEPPAPEKTAAPGAPVAAPPAKAPEAAPAAPRTSIKLTRGIAVTLANGQAALPSGTSLKFLAMDGDNVRVTWNGNAFLVPAAATDVGDGPPPTPEAPPAAAAPAIRSAAAPVPEGTKPARKPADDL
jgi:hypothetical protein